MPQVEQATHSVFMEAEFSLRKRPALQLEDELGDFGEFVGVGVGTCVGTLVGCLVGALVGVLVGALVGVLVGAFVMIQVMPGPASVSRNPRTHLQALMLRLRTGLVECSGHERQL